MKRFTMPSQRELQAIYPPKSTAFDEAIRATLHMLPDDIKERKTMKRKIPIGLAAALILIFALACTALAAGMGVFGKMAEQLSGGYSELYRVLDEKSAAVSYTHPEGKEDASASDVTFQLAQAYVDGNSLFVTYEATGMTSTVDYSWKPTEQKRAQMSQNDAFLLQDTNDEVRQQFIREMLETAKQNGHASGMFTTRRCSLGAYLAYTDEYLNPTFTDERIQADGTAMGVKQFDLPNALPNEETLPLEFSLFEEKTYHYFDGEHWYMLRGDQKDLGLVRVDVPLKHNDVQMKYHAEKTFESVQAAIDVEVTEVTIRATLEMKSLDGHLFSQKSENWKKGNVAELNLYVDGEEGIALSGGWEDCEATVCKGEIVYIRPNPLPEKLEWIPTYYTKDGDGSHLEERPEEAITIYLTEP